MNAFGRAQEAMAELGREPIDRLKTLLATHIATSFPADRSAEINLVPVDRVAAGILAALTAPEAIGARIHLATDNRIRSEEICRIAEEELGVKVRLADPTLSRNVTLPLYKAVLQAAGDQKLANVVEKLGTIFGVYGEWGQPIHDVGNDVRLLGLPIRRPETAAGFRMLCRHNKYVQEFAKVRDLDEIARRERVWEQAIDAIEYETGPPGGRHPRRASSASCWARRSSSRPSRRADARLARAAGERILGPAAGRCAWRRQKGARMSDDTGFLNRLRERGEEVPDAGLRPSSARTRTSCRRWQGAMRGKEKLEEAVGRVLKQMNIPTRSEFKRAVARIERARAGARGAQGARAQGARRAASRLASRRGKAAEVATCRASPSPGRRRSWAGGCCAGWSTARGADAVLAVDITPPPAALQGVRHRMVDLTLPGADQRLVEVFREEGVDTVFHTAFFTSPRRDTATLTSWSRSARCTSRRPRPRRRAAPRDALVHGRLRRARPEPELPHRGEAAGPDVAPRLGARQGGGGAARALLRAPLSRHAA